MGQRLPLQREQPSAVLSTLGAADGGSDEALLRSLADLLDTFKQLLETCTSAELNALCARYEGLYRFATLLEMLAAGIADGSIPVPD